MSLRMGGGDDCQGNLTLRLKLEFTAPPLLRGGEMEIRLINYAYVIKASIKIPKMGVGGSGMESFQVGENVKVLGEWYPLREGMEALGSFPHTLPYASEERVLKLRRLNQ